MLESFIIKNVWDINEVQFAGIIIYDSPVLPVNGGNMYRDKQTGSFTEAWPNREAARAAAQKIKPMNTYATEDVGAGNQSSTFYDGLSGLLNNGLNIAGKVAGIATAFRGGTASPAAQREAAEIQKNQAGMGDKKLWLIGGIGAAVLLVLGFFLFRRK